MKVTASFLVAIACMGATPQPAPQPTPALSAHVVTSKEIKFYADIAAKTELAVETARAEAVSSAKLYLQAAQMKCRQQLAVTPEYKAVSDELNKDLRVLGDVRSMTPEARATAGADLEQVNRTLIQMESDAIAKDTDVRAATDILAGLGSAPQPVDATAAATAPPSMPAPVAAPTPLPEPTKSASVAPTPQPSPAIASPRPPGTLKGLELGRAIHEGWDRLMAKDYAGGLSSFNQVAKSDTHDITILLGRGICEYELKDYKAADKDLDKAYSLGGTSSQNSRQLTIAYAAGLSMDGNPMRAARVLQDLTKPGYRMGKTDEELQNDLGIAMTHADVQAHQAQLYQDSLKYYMDCDKTLNEQKKDGTARWGVNWIDAGSAAQKWQAYRQAVANVEQAVYAFHRYDVAMIRANSNYQEIKGGLRLHGDAEIAQYTREWHQAIFNVRTAQANVDAANQRLRSVEAPPFPERIEHDWQEPR
jgi:tetratricopeptide (TPR) repeat protein